MSESLKKLVVIGGNKLQGEIVNQTSKNATLPIMSACVLSSGVSVIKCCPNIVDVKNMAKILRLLGAKVKKQNKDYVIDTTNLTGCSIDCKLSKTMRSSIFLLGSLLSRFKTAVITMPGGCNIGKRPIDIHINAFKKLGVKIIENDSQIFFDATNAKSNTIKLKLPSVGATENIVQFASLLKGKTVIKNVAREPEVVDLCNFLSLMGAKILGAGTSTITIYGVDKLNNIQYTPIPDRIVAGTLMIAVALTGGDVTIKNACSHQNEKLIKILSLMGCQIDIKHDIIHIVSNKKLNSISKLSTGYYPDFSTDLQSQLLTLASVSNGKMTICENIFENRFLIVDELKKLGADIKKLDNSKVVVNGVDHLNGSQVLAKDLRGGASLVLAGLVAVGKTEISNVQFIDRGYEQIEKMLTLLGADIKRV